MASLCQLVMESSVVTSGNAFDSSSTLLLSSRGQQVMMQWEREYMERCVDALEIREGEDRVLEVGFGLAHSASRVQSFKPLSHTIIECDAAVLERAEAFKAANEGVEVIRGLWQEVLPMLGEVEFDCVFFDDFPLPEVEQRLELKAKPKRALNAGRSRWHDFLDAVLLHVAPGARITGYLARHVDLRRPGCKVEVTSMAVQPSADCEYFPYDTALVPVIMVLDPAAARVPVVELHKSVALAPSRRSRKFVDAFVKAQEAQDGAQEDRSYDEYDDYEAPSKSEDRDNAGISSQRGVVDASSQTLYADRESRKAFLASLRARKQQAQAKPSQAANSSQMQ